MIKVIKTKKEHETAMNRIAELIGGDPASDSPEGDELEVLAHLVADYEKKHYDIGLPTPLEAIEFRIEQQHLRPRDLVPYLGSASRVSEVLRGKRQLSIQMIRSLNEGLGIPAEVLLRKQPQTRREPRVTSTRDILTDFPADVFREMVKRKWLKFHGSLDEAKRRARDLLKDFLCFGNHIEAIPAFNRQSLRGKSSDNAAALLAWKTRVLRLASKRRVRSRFDRADVTTDFIYRLVTLSRLEAGPRLAVEELQNHGIAVVIEAHLPTTHLDGAAMKLSNGTPVIGLTLRHDRLDNFFFCLFHELGHVVLHISKGKADLFLDDLQEAPTDEFEWEADDFARQCLMPEKDWRRFWEGDDFTVETVRREAKRVGIHGAILAGRIQNEKNDYKSLSRIVRPAKVRHLFHDSVKRMLLG
jgi:HTH-type transcriptional regulator/antitoxin HigA